MKIDKKSKQAIFSELGKYCLDISKLIFGGVILAGIMQLNINQMILFIVGLLVVTLFALSGLLLIALSKNK